MRFKMLNWEDRNPRNDYKTIPWFRMDADFFRSKKLFGLPLNDKWAWACLLGLAAKENKGGLIDATKEWVSKEIDYPCDHIENLVQTLEQRGLLTTDATRTSDVHETNAVRSLRNERNVTNVTNNDEGLFAPLRFLEIWNANCGDLPKVKRLSKSRTDKIRARRAEEPDLEYWVECIKRLAASDFASGKVKSDRYPNGWTADLDWLIKNDTNHAKVSEGKYANKKSAAKQQSMRVFTDGDFA